jgi:hypothetical protein
MEISGHAVYGTGWILSVILQEKLIRIRIWLHFLNRLNADWVAATRRMSPAVLIELLEVTGKEYAVK